MVSIFHIDCTLPPLPALPELSAKNKLNEIFGEVNGYFPAQLTLELKTNSNSKGCSIVSLKLKAFSKLHEKPERNELSSIKPSCTVGPALSEAENILTEQTQKNTDVVLAKACAKQVAMELQRYFSGEALALESLWKYLPSHHGNNFADASAKPLSFYEKIFLALEKVKPGNVVSYSSLADVEPLALPGKAKQLKTNSGSTDGLGMKATGNKYGRAIGGGVASNPFVLIVPCHRVVHKPAERMFSAKQTLFNLLSVSGGSYAVRSSGGDYLPLKKYLLALEFIATKKALV